jgi:hypothetical protein
MSTVRVTESLIEGAVLIWPEGLGIAEATA